MELPPEAMHMLRQNSLSHWSLKLKLIQAMITLAPVSYFHLTGCDDAGAGHNRELFSGFIQFSDFTALLSKYSAC